MASNANSCPCGTGKDYAACCGPYHDGQSLPPTAEATMRSRYTAFSMGKADYIKATLAPGFDEDFNDEDFAESAKQTQWQALEIRDLIQGGPDDTEGWVEFVARFRLHGRPMVHHEKSRFVRGGETNRWLCADSEMNPKAPQRVVAKVGRNDPCPCGSGKKYKKCCGA
ncbi:MAG: SEC-C domain-containing protein [Rhodospirillum sp.]|nr:SEC-C domain-containing protein [Rhodospirillum sp.]MCF8489653.1 SEC-C domain-containing protein [Rhodospirillum sp.]MCF8500543.1 SEC-C domain-containing protein [Rhodospirillum sp.]